MDVLLGRGKPIQEHAGNIRYHVILDQYQVAYEEAKKYEKMQIADTVVRIVHHLGGRFLKQQHASWIVVDDTVARDKVSHAFRTRRTASMATASSTNSSSSTTTITAKDTVMMGNPCGMDETPTVMSNERIAQQQPEQQPEQQPLWLVDDDFALLPNTSENSYSSSRRRREEEYGDIPLYQPEYCPTCASPIFSNGNDTTFTWDSDNQQIDWFENGKRTKF